MIYWLTTNVERIFEGFCYLRIKFNYQVVLWSNSAISFSDHIRDPLPEIITDNCVNDIDNPLSRELPNITLIRHMMTNLLVGHSLSKDILNREAIIEWNMQMLGHIRFDDYISVRNKKENLQLLTPLIKSLRK